MSKRYGLPTDAELRHLTRRKLVAVAVSLVVAGVLSLAVAAMLDGIRVSTVLYLAAGCVFFGTIFMTGDLTPSDLSKREVLTAGTRRRRRRLRWALLRGRTDDLDEADRRTCHYLAPVVRVRSWTVLLIDGTVIPVWTAGGAGHLTRQPPTDSWATVVLAVSLVVVVAGIAVLGLHLAELRAAGRHLADQEP